MDLIKQRIKWVMAALPQESTSTNIMRHILKVVREEYETGSKVIFVSSCTNFKLVKISE